MMLLYLFSLVVAVQPQRLPGSCSFEDSTCGYTSDPAFSSWTLNPSGHFIAVDSALLDGQEKAVLLGAEVEQQDWSCLRLVYQIIDQGSLQVQQRSEGESFDRVLWTAHKPSDSWLITSIDLQNTTEPYQIVIEGRPGETEGCSVAIFEINIIHGYCIECDFEDPLLCGYNNQWNTNMNWYLGGGAAQDPQDNLPDDYTRRDGTGHYMYVDSVYAKAFQEVAKLVSPMMTVPLSGCLSFQYQQEHAEDHMFSVFSRDQAGQYQELWRADTQRENQEDQVWIPVQMDIKAPYPLEVVFEVAFNSPKGGHVVLDDISFSPEFCNAGTEPTFDPSVANCDFEKGFCQYTQTLMDSPMWKRVSVRPNVYRVGDHTTGAGSFLLANARLALQSGYVSRLYGPVLPGNQKYCLKFYYSLRGFSRTDQALALYLYDQTGTAQERIWTQSQKTRDIWIAIDLTIQIQQSSQVVFFSSCQSFWNCGSVALDDISVSLGDCDLPTGLSLSAPSHCDFETGLCGYTQDKEGDNGDWVQARGPTPTSYTGPRGDHTTGLGEFIPIPPPRCSFTGEEKNMSGGALSFSPLQCAISGYYLHIEASLMVPGHNARLLSSPLRGSRKARCLRFYYHMYGSGTGHLSVLLRSEQEETDLLLWKRNREQGISWLRATVSYQCDHQHQIVFEATRGISIRSDIALDDIKFERGPCPDVEDKIPPLSANFNDIE